MHWLLDWMMNGIDDHQMQIMYLPWVSFYSTHYMIVVLLLSSVDQHHHTKDYHTHERIQCHHCYHVSKTMLHNDHSHDQYVVRYVNLYRLLVVVPTEHERIQQDKAMHHSHYLVVVETWASMDSLRPLDLTIHE